MKNEKKVCSTLLCSFSQALQGGSGGLRHPVYGAHRFHYDPSRHQRFWTAILGRGGWFFSVRSLRRDRSGAFRTVLDAFGEQFRVVTVSFDCYVLGLAVGLDQNFTKSTENASKFSLSPEKRDFPT